MSKYPKINYIGNKDKLVDWIIDNFPMKKGVVLDLFSGGNSVSYALKEKNYTVYSNDALYSNFVISKAIIENKDKLGKTSLAFKFDGKKVIAAEKSESVPTCCSCVPCIYLYFSVSYS